jgi:hypothetical protein
MNGSVGGGVLAASCVNPDLVDQWRKTSIRPKDTASARVTRGAVHRVLDDRHQHAETLQEGDFFIVTRPDDDEGDDDGHPVWLARVVKDLEILTKSEVDHLGTTFPEGYAVVRAHFLEWQNKRKRIYYVDNANTVILESHLVASAPIEMEVLDSTNRAGQALVTMTDDEADRCFNCVH